MTPTAIITALDRIDAEAADLADAIKRMIPDSPARDDPTWEAHTATGAVGANAERAARAMRRALLEIGGGR